jgi:NAD(P)-dependent dehydrogenase (short-subunit alcohol dehydrogenase family)
LRVDRDLSDKVAIVTGAAKNLGRGVAEALARRGADIVVHHHDDSSRADAEETARLVKAAGTRGEVVSGDLTDAATPARLFDRSTPPKHPSRSPSSHR